MLLKLVSKDVSILGDLNGSPGQGVCCPAPGLSLLTASSNLQNKHTGSISLTERDSEASEHPYSLSCCELASGRVSPIRIKTTSILKHVAATQILSTFRKEAYLIRHLAGRKRG